MARESLVTPASYDAEDESCDSSGIFTRACLDNPGDAGGRMCNVPGAEDGSGGDTIPGDTVASCPRTPSGSNSPS